MKNERVRVEALADQGNAMLRDQYAGLTTDQLNQLAAVAEMLVELGYVGRVAAQTLLMACGNEQLRRASGTRGNP